MGRPRKRDQVIDAATDQFLETGFEGARVDAIASRGDVSKRTVYNHFASKEALFEAVVERLWERLHERAESLVDLSWPVEDALRAVAEHTVDTLTRPDVLGLLRLVVSEAPRTPVLTERFFSHGRGPAFDALVRYLIAMDRHGRLRIPQPELAALQFLGLFKEALVWPRLLGAEPLPAARREAVIEQAVASFMTTYATGSQAGRGTHE